MHRLKTAVVSDRLWFVVNDQRIAKIYAPGQFKQGASLIHLDFTEYSKTDNHLMTPFTIPDVACHEMVPVLTAIYNAMRDPTSACQGNAENPFRWQTIQGRASGHVLQVATTPQNQYKKWQGIIRQEF